MIDFSKKITQTSLYTGKESELLMSYVVSKENSYCEFDNVVFGYASNGAKKIIFSNDSVIHLKPGVVAMGCEKLSAQTEVNNVSIENPLICFRLDISKKKVWDILDKINDSYSIPKLIKEEQKLESTEVYTGNGSELVFASLKNIQNLYTQNVKYKDYWLNLKIEELILSCLQTDMHNQLITNYDSQKIQDHPLAHVIHHIKSNIHDTIDIKTLADKACMSRATFFRQFKHHFGITPHNFIQAEKIKEAQKILNTSKKSINEIAYQLGYSSPSYFKTNFKKYSDLSLKSYRK